MAERPHSGGPFENGAGPADGGGGRAVPEQVRHRREGRPGLGGGAGGVFDTYGMEEIGIDVVAGRQGEGLGRAAVAAAVRAILDRGAGAVLWLRSGNIRSQRTALEHGLPARVLRWHGRLRPFGMMPP